MGGLVKFLIFSATFLSTVTPFLSDRLAKGILFFHPFGFMIRPLGWPACLKELEIPPGHLAWASPTLPVQLLASPGRYSLIILPDFNEEEYATLPADDGDGDVDM